mgnify:CR=1 FL=1
MPLATSTLSPTDYSQSADGFRCEQCGHEMAVPLFCDHCATDYPERRGMGAFAILGLPQRWDLDEDALDAVELRLATRLHPDRWTTRGDRAHKHALLAWSAVNVSLGALKDPFDRADTLLRATDEWELLADDKVALPQAFLLEQLDLQEELEAPLTEERRSVLQRTVRHELRELRRVLGGHFEVAESASHAGSAAGDARITALRAARAVVDKSRYWRNAQRTLRGDAPR